MAKKNDYYTPTQLLMNHPEIARIWDAPKIGYLLMLNLVKGKKLRRGCLVCESDLLRLYRFSFEVTDT